MTTLIAVSALGIICLILEILNLRKFLVSIITLGLLAILGMTAYEFISEKSVLELDSFQMIISTPFSKAFSILFIILTILPVTMSPRYYMDHISKISDYVALKIFILAGAIAMISFGNMAMFFIGLEVLSIAVYVLASSNVKNVKSNEAGLKYFIMGAFASSFVLFGIALIYGAVGSFNIRIIMATAPTASQPIWMQLGFLMLAIGMLFKASIFPFHFWAPDVYQGSPTLTTTVMSTLVKVAGIGALFKMFTIMSSAFTPSFQTTIVILSILTMTVANLTGLRQNNIKRMMAYSGISHAGFMIMTLLALTESANAVLYYAAAYSLAAIAAFAVIMAVCEDKKDEHISHFYGLAKKQPVLAVILAMAMLSMAGIPIFAGFFAKLFVLGQMLQNGHLALVIFGVINSIIAVYYYMGIVNSMVVKPNDEAVRVSKRYKTIALIAILLNLILGIFPNLIMGLSL